MIGPDLGMLNNCLNDSCSAIKCESYTTLLQPTSSANSIAATTAVLEPTATTITKGRKKKEFFALLMQF